MKSFNKKQLEVLKSYWKAARKIKDRYWKEMNLLEKGASDKLKMKIELFHCDGSLAGIGAHDREYTLLYATDLEK
jgi:hypothetical protein